MYYLKTRYYDPNIGRFISPDNVITDVGGDVRGNNLYAYCFNNPVNMSDEDGNWPSWATKVLIGTAIIAALVVVTVATAGTGTVVAAVAAAALNSAVIGASVGMASGAAAGAVVHRISTGGWEGAGEAALNGAATLYMTGAITGAITGGILGYANYRPEVSACFVAGTAVLTEVGHIAIENIRVGDMVWSENPETGQKALKRVAQTFVRETDELIHIKAGVQDITTTPEHPFWVAKKGWTKAIKLRAGDILVLQGGGYIIVEKVLHELLELPLTVYNFEVEDFHTYYVGICSVLVHNACGDVLPKNAKSFTGKNALSNASKHLQKYHGVDPKAASQRLHLIKTQQGLTANYDVIIDRTGNVYNQFRHWLGTLTK